MENRARQPLNQEQLRTVTGGRYAPGAYQAEALAFFRERVGDEMYQRIMGGGAGPKNPYVPARLFLNLQDWKKYIWIEQNGSLADFPG